jgi:hypothetical protein
MASRNAGDLRKYNRSHESGTVKRHRREKTEKERSKMSGSLDRFMTKPDRIEPSDSPHVERSDDNVDSGGENNTRNQSQTGTGEIPSTSNQERDTEEVSSSSSESGDDEQESDPILSGDPHFWTCEMNDQLKQKKSQR